MQSLIGQPVQQLTTSQVSLISGYTDGNICHRYSYRCVRTTSVSQQVAAMADKSDNEHDTQPINNVHCEAHTVIHARITLRQSH